MRSVLLIILLGLICVGNLAQCNETNSAPRFAPLPLELPGPSLGNNGPQSLPAGPHIEPHSDRPKVVICPIGVTNLARGKSVTSSVKKAILGELHMITDGSKEAFKYDLVEIAKGVQWVQIDLQQAYPINAIAIWHNHYRLGQPIRGVIVQVADDAGFTNNVRTLFNNDYENCAGLGVGTEKQYFEEYFGKVIDAKGTKARFVRCYSNGERNCYAEVEVWGLSNPE